MEQILSLFTLIDTQFIFHNCVKIIEQTQANSLQQLTIQHAITALFNDYWTTVACCARKICGWSI